MLLRLFPPLNFGVGVFGASLFDFSFVTLVSYSFFHCCVIVSLSDTHENLVIASVLLSSREQPQLPECHMSNATKTGTTTEFS